MTKRILFLYVSPRSILCNLLIKTLFNFSVLKKRYSYCILNIRKSLCNSVTLNIFNFAVKIKFTTLLPPSKFKFTNDNSQMKWIFLVVHQILYCIKETGHTRQLLQCIVHLSKSRVNILQEKVVHHYYNFAHYISNSVKLRTR